MLRKVARENFFSKFLKTLETVEIQSELENATSSYLPLSLGSLTESCQIQEGKNHIWSTMYHQCLTESWTETHAVVDEKRIAFSLALCFVLYYFSVPFLSFCFCSNVGISTSQEVCICLSINFTYILALLFSEEHVKCGRTVRRKSVKFTHTGKMLEQQIK